MRQRNDTGYTLLVAADPPFEVPAGETVDHPIAVAGLTIIEPEAERPGIFNPSDWTVPEVLAHLARADVDLAEATRVLDAEAADEDRAGISRHRDSVLAGKTAAADPAGPAGSDTPGEQQ